TDVTYRSGVKALQVNRRSGFTETSERYIEYDKPGSKILDRINTLYGKWIGGEFFDNGWFSDTYDVSEVAKAERTLDQLNTMVKGLPR
ncbi:MAG: hypothetical protein ACRC14_09085, partial [Paracoccaceae bacterium]